MSEENVLNPSNPQLVGLILSGAKARKTLMFTIYVKWSERQKHCSACVYCRYSS